MSGAWADFEQPQAEGIRKTTKLTKGCQRKEEELTTTKQDDDDGTTTCDWGFSRQEAQAANGGDGEPGDTPDSESSKFIPIYERYLSDKQSLDKQQTKNFGLYGNNPQKALRMWFENEGHEFEMKTTEQPGENQYICRLDLPIGEHDFTLTSDSHAKKQHAVDEICMAACRMLDECDLLYSWQSVASSKEEDLDKKRRIVEINKEDDIELDSTSCSKRHCNSTTNSQTTSKATISGVNTYESLMAKWSELNMSILQLKAKLVRMDVTAKQQQQQATVSTNHRSQMGGCGDDDEEVDPLDEYMSSLETTKTKPSMDDKIEKSRIKSQISAYEREQKDVSRLIELAKPKFDLDKACPPARSSSSSSSSTTTTRRTS